MANDHKPTADERMKSLGVELQSMPLSEQMQHLYLDELEKISASRKAEAGRVEEVEELRPLTEEEFDAFQQSLKDKHP